MFLLALGFVFGESLGCDCLLGRAGMVSKCKGIGGFDTCFCMGGSYYMIRRGKAFLEGYFAAFGKEYFQVRYNEWKPLIPLLCSRSQRHKAVYQN